MTIELLDQALHDVNAQSELLDYLEDHFNSSWRYMQTIRDGLDEKEALLIGEPWDEISSKVTKSKIFDPRLSTIVIERSARVAAQLPRGEAMAVSEDDIGKNLLMNLSLDNYKRTANEQYRFLQKLRMSSMYSQVYGSLFALVPWRVNSRTGFVGPEVNLIAMRDSFPQPGLPNLNEASWFIQAASLSYDWIKAQKGESWNKEAVELLGSYLKDWTENMANPSKYGSSTDETADEDQRSFIERRNFPTIEGSKGYARIRLLTEYNADLNAWISWCPAVPGVKNSRALILRVVKDAYVKGMLPVVKKDCFPLLDSVIGMGEFERGKSIQYAMNSLINLYMDGVKYSIFPPLHINWQNAVMSTIKWGPGERWLMKNPNGDVQAMQNINPQGLNTFQNTYQFLLSALQSQAGTTEVSSPNNTQPTVGRTPQAVQFLRDRENARDSYEGFMMDTFVQDIFDRWIALINNKMPGKLMTRLFEDEIKRIEKKYPDVKELVGKGGSVSIDPKRLKNKMGYDYYHEFNSMMAPQSDVKAQEVSSILNLAMSNGFIDIAAKQGYEINVGELFYELVSLATSIRDPDKIVKQTNVGGKTPEEASTQDVDSLDEVPIDPATGQPMVQPPVDPNAVPPQPQPAPPAPEVPIDPATGQPIQVQPEQPQMVLPEGIDPALLEQIKDPEIMAAIQQALQGGADPSLMNISEIPAA